MTSTHTVLVERWVTGLSLAIICVCVPVADARAQVGDLFTAVDSAAAIPRRAPEPPDTVTGDVTTLRSRNVRIDMDRLAAALVNAAGGAAPPLAPLVLNLFDDAVFPASVTGTAPTASGGYSLTGRLEGVEFGSLVLVVNGDIVAGTVQAPPDTYTIRSAGGGVHVIREVDLSTLPPEAEPLDIAEPATGGPAPVAAGDPAAIPGSIADPPRARGDDGSVIDVLVVHTPAATWYAGGTAEIEALIDLAVAEANQAYADSNVIQRIRLVHREEIVHVERSEADDVAQLRHPRDGVLDAVHTLRDDHQADLVALITGVSRVWCGRVTAIGPETPDRGFSITAVSCLSPNYTFAHELGHNMGLRHDVYADPKVTPYPDNHGYVNQRAFVEGAPEAARWRTIMALETQCRAEGGLSCFRLQRFSNPEQSWDGDPQGVAGASNARRVLDATRSAIARFRARTTAWLSPDPRAVPYRSDGVWRRFTVHAAEPIRVVANPAYRSPSPRVGIGAGASPGSCSPSIDEAVERGDGETVYLAACRSGVGVVTLVRAADDAPIRSYTLPIVNAGGSSASLTPDPATVPFANDGAWHPFTVTSTDPVRVVVNPGGTLGRVEITSEQSESNFCPPEPNDMFERGSGQTIYLAGCVPGEGTVRLERVVDGSVLRTYTFPIQALPNRCVETLGTLSASVTIARDGFWTTDCHATSSRPSRPWYARFYSFMLERPTRVRLDRRSELDAWLLLREGDGPGGAILAVDVNCDQGATRCVLIKLPAGPYTVEVRTLRPGLLGAFTLTLSAGPLTSPPFTDDPIVPGMTVKAAHVLELRQRMDALLESDERPGFPWTDLEPGAIPKAVHLLELRAALNQAFTVARRPLPSFTDTVVQAGVTAVKAVHFNELRRALELLE